MTEIRYVTGVNADYFYILFPLFTSLKHTDPAVKVHVCDFGLTEPQRVFLRRKGLLLEAPAELVGAHPWRCKAALGRYVAGIPWDVLVWLDSDMLAVAPISAGLSDIAEQLRTTGTPLAVCVDASVVADALAVAPAPHFSRLAPDRGITLQTLYLNSGFFACTSRDFLAAWDEMCQQMPEENLFEQNAFNLVAHPAGFLPLPMVEWNLCGSNLGKAEIHDADGKLRVTHSESDVRILHATSHRPEDIIKQVVTILAAGRAFEVMIKLLCHPKLLQWQMALLQEGLVENAADLAGAGLGRADTTSAGESDEQAKAHFFKGNELFLLRRFSEAAEEFKAALHYKPGHPRSLFNLAMSEIELSHLAEAQTLLRQAVSVDTEYLEAYGNLVLLCQRMGDHAAATHYLDIARAKWPNDPGIVRIADGFDRESYAQHAGNRRKQLTEYLIRESGLKALSGPFAGMILHSKTSWGDGDLAPRILGCYEEELTDALERAIARSPSVVINIGCAEGHYAVGLARRLPTSTVFAHDISTDAHRLCRESAEANGVSDRLIIDGACTHEILRKHLSTTRHALAVLDCEGAERFLLDPAAVPELSRCDIIIECHDFLDRSITPTLVDRFTKTHEVEKVVEAGRNPNLYPLLHHLHNSDRWLLMGEGRPEFMHWLVFWSKTHGAGGTN